MKFQLNEYILHIGGVVYSRSHIIYNDNKLLEKELAALFVQSWLDCNHRLQLILEFKHQEIYGI